MMEMGVLTSTHKSYVITKVKHIEKERSIQATDINCQ